MHDASDDDDDDDELSGDDQQAAAAAAPFFALNPCRALLHPAIVAHAETRAVRTAELATVEKADGAKIEVYRYADNHGGPPRTAPGLCKHLVDMYYPHYREGKNSARGRKNLRGSSKKVGDRVHRHLLYYLLDRRPPRSRGCAMADTLWNYFTGPGGVRHTVQAVELPVVLDAIGTQTGVNHFFRAR